MQTTRTTAPTLAALALAAAQLITPHAARAQANLVQNGGFEAATTLDAPLGSGSTAIPGWTVVAQGGQNVAVIQNGYYGLSTPYGVQFVDLTGYSDSTPYGGLTQTLSTVPGQTYLLTLSLGADQASGIYAGPVAASASVGGVTQTFTFAPAAGAAGNVWQPFTLGFTAGSAGTALTITGVTSTGGQYIGLDNISVVAAPEPSPAAALLLGTLGLSALALRARRRSPAA